MGTREADYDSRAYFRAKVGEDRQPLPVQIKDVTPKKSKPLALPAPKENPDA